MKWLLLISLALGLVMAQNEKGVYEYFNEGGIASGLTANEPGFFKLNGKEVRLISGAMHYYRVHPAYWRDRLKKMRAVGLNTVETYISWNLHEPEKDKFDFGDGGNDMSMFLDVRSFIQMAQEEDLLVIVRPGPYICTEWDFGGLPSWLQRDPDMKVRTNYQPYLERTRIYLNAFLDQISDLQYTLGGPIIAIQLENEYGSFDNKDKEYLQFIKAVYDDNGIQNLLYFTSDGVNNGWSGALEELLYTANFQGNPEGNLNTLLELQPNKPAMVMEYWSGWFDHWFEEHHTTDEETFARTLETILSPQFNGSVNFYMFHGGTNFAFMAGANYMADAPNYAADVTSYDYDAPLSEAGDYTPKYHRIRDLVEQYAHPKLFRPEMVSETPKNRYEDVVLQFYLPWEMILGNVPETSIFRGVDSLVSMERLPMNGDSGQSYGYILYRKEIPLELFVNGSTLRAGPVKDFGQILLNGQLLEKEQIWINTEVEATLVTSETPNIHRVDVLVENMARVNFGWAKDFLQQKGLPYNATYTIDGADVTGINIYALEFKSSWIDGIVNWDVIRDIDALTGPVLLRSTFVIQGEPTDTWLDMSEWTKGIVFINGFNLGRYWNVGPQQNLYVPGPILKNGGNIITIFEQIQPGKIIRFSDTANVGRKTIVHKPNQLPGTLNYQ